MSFGTDLVKAMKCSAKRVPVLIIYRQWNINVFPKWVPVNTLKYQAEMSTGTHFIKAIKYQAEMSTGTHFVIKMEYSAKLSTGTHFIKSVIIQGNEMSTDTQSELKFLSQNNHYFDFTASIDTQNGLIYSSPAIMAYY